MNDSVGQKKSTNQKSKTYLAAITGSIIIAWITVGYRSIKAAIANPVEPLRME